jgi:hypothetical protein
MRRIPLAIAVMVSLLGVAGVVVLRMKADAPVHYHAGFTVYVNGIRQEYSAPQYMHAEPCPVGTATPPPGDPQEEKAHLHDGVGDVVHVHRTGATWGDLFKNIGVSFPEPSAVVGYESGKKIDGILIRPIQPYESVIIVSGPATGIDLTGFVTKQHILDVEKKSESCAAP